MWQLKNSEDHVQTSVNKLLLLLLLIGNNLAEKNVFTLYQKSLSERIFHCKVIEKRDLFPAVQELWKLSLKCKNFDVTLLRTIADNLTKYVVSNKNLRLI